MLFSLASLKKRAYRDREGNLAIAPKLLHGRAAVRLVEQAIEVFDDFAGRSRSEYDPRVLEAVMGDYRLGRCVEACLLRFYAFRQPDMSDVLSEGQLDALRERGLDSPTALRLAVWDAANAQGGFVLPAEREAVLKRVAAESGLPRDPTLLNRLLLLDSDGVAMLGRAEQRPTARDVVRLYNRGAVQTLLAHASRVEMEAGRLPGAALKRLYFMAKRTGVLVEVEESPGGVGFLLALFGPEHAFGAADRYGLRLSVVTLSLLRALLAEGGDEAVRAVAHLAMNGRDYRFVVDAEVLKRLEYAPDTRRAAQGNRIAEAGVTYSVGGALEARDAEVGGGPEPSFDSLVEARFFKEYAALERQGYTHGWRLEREPDPVVAPGVLLIPDFGFRRGETRVFMEIAGFWSPQYRERKVSKLRRLAEGREGEVAILIAAPHDAMSAFSGLPFPVLPFKTSVRATDVLATLDSVYGSRDERREAAGSRIEALRTAAVEQGLVPENEIAQQMSAYTRSELLESGKLLEDEAAVFVPGVGLVSRVALERALAAVGAALAVAGGRLSTGEASEVAGLSFGATVDIEPLAELNPAWRIERPSLFEASLVAE